MVAPRKDIVIVASKRTPFTAFGGSLKGLTATDLGVEQVSFQRLLDFVGYDGEKRTIPLGRNASSDDFEGPAGSATDQRGSDFRQRKPRTQRESIR